MGQFRVRALYVDEFQSPMSASPATLPPKLSVARPDGNLEPQLAVLKDGFYEFEVSDDELRSRLERDLAEADIEWSNTTPTVAFRIKIRDRPAAAHA